MGGEWRKGCSPMAKERLLTKRSRVTAALLSRRKAGQTRAHEEIWSQNAAAHEEEMASSGKGASGTVVMAGGRRKVDMIGGIKSGNHRSEDRSACERSRISRGFKEVKRQRMVLKSNNVMYQIGSEWESSASTTSRIMVEIVLTKCATQASYGALMSTEANIDS